MGFSKREEEYLRRGPSLGPTTGIKHVVDQV